MPAGYANSIGNPCRDVRLNRQESAEAPKTKKRFMDKIRELTSRSKSQQISESAIADVSSETVEETGDQEKEVSGIGGIAGMGRSNKRFTKRILATGQNSTGKQSP